MIALDDYVIDKNIEKIDFIKIDIEGAEFHALKGMKTVLKKYKPVLLIEILHYQDDRKLILSFLKDLGYQQLFIADNGSIKAKESNETRENYIFTYSAKIQGQ